MDCKKTPVYTTTQRAHYVAHRPLLPTKKRPKTKESDPGLITGQAFNNLVVNQQQQKTKTWPSVMNYREELLHYLKRLQLCDPDKYDRYLKCPGLDIDHIDKSLRLAGNSVYGLSYLPRDYLPLWRQKRTFCDKDQISDHLTYFTTYREFYNRINSEKRFADTKRECKKVPKPQGYHDVYETLLRKYFTKRSSSTYQDTICMPALVMARNDMPGCYLDQYSSPKDILLKSQ